MKPNPRRLDPAIYPHKIEITTRFGDMDIARHLNNVAIARFYEDARVRFNWEVLGVANADVGASTAFRPLIAHVAIAYLREGNFPDPILAATGVRELGRTSFVIASALFQNGGALGTCDSVIVLTDANGPAPVPADIRAKLESLQIPAAAR